MEGATTRGLGFRITFCISSTNSMTCAGDIRLKLRGSYIRVWGSELHDALWSGMQEARRVQLTRCLWPAPARSRAASRARRCLRASVTKMVSSAHKWLDKVEWIRAVL